MSLKALLGMDQFPVREEEIMRQIREAYIKGTNQVVFSSGSKRVRINLNRLSPEGLMRGYEDYYK